MKKVVSSLLVASLLGFSVNLFAQTGELKEPTPAVLELIKKHKLEQVNFDYVKKIIGNGSRGAVEAILVDARPELKYQKGTIPSSINIPDTNFEEFYSKYDFLSKDKNKEIIVYCGGFGCEKSPIVADL